MFYQGLQLYTTFRKLATVMRYLKLYNYKGFVVVCFMLGLVCLVGNFWAIPKRGEFKRGYINSYC